MTAAISVRNLCKSFGNKVVLDGVDIEIAAGKSLVIIGGSGTGKSVFIKCILGLIEPDSGVILVDGNNVSKKKTRAEFMRRSGVLFQGSALFDSISVWENVAFGLQHILKMPKRQARDRAVENLAAVGLDAQVADLYPAEISGGMQRRVALARAVAMQPDVLFFDEPTTGLDPIMSSVINQLIRESVTKLGATAVTITHDMASARYIGDHIAMLHQGKLVWQGEMGALDTTDNPYIQQFIHGRHQGPILV
jgi:phospholipid/cholesterol/gamma-HCH transport system ATP-binding protein